jgi:hypothetical protein
MTPVVVAFFQQFHVLFSYLASINLARLIEHLEAKKTGRNVIQFAQPLSQIKEASAAIS